MIVPEYHKKIEKKMETNIDSVIFDFDEKRPLDEGAFFVYFDKQIVRTESDKVANRINYSLKRLLLVGFEGRGAILKFFLETHLKKKPDPNFISAILFEEKFCFFANVECFAEYLNQIPNVTRQISPRLFLNCFLRLDDKTERSREIFEDLRKRVCNLEYRRFISKMIIQPLNQTIRFRFYIIDYTVIFNALFPLIEGRNEGKTEYFKKLYINTAYW